jgi:mannose-6-phosphate isomerase-like protein (cupin superfamily)
MARPGEVIRNPKTGETVTFLETGPALLRLEMTAERSAAPSHLHPKIEERWDLQEGTVRFTVGGAERVLTAPAELTIPRGTAHKFASDGPIKIVVTYEPAGGFAGFLETIYALARDGKTDAKGMPNLLQSAVIGRAHLDDYALPFPPVWAQRILFAVLAPIGRLFGYRSTYP